jgi:hypothetical protein
MNISEFYEAFSRIAERLSPIPLGEEALDWNETRRIS